MTKNMKITIEGHDIEPIVHENVEMYTLITKTSECVGGGSYGDTLFAGYVAARSHADFMRHGEKSQKEESPND